MSVDANADILAEVLLRKDKAGNVTGSYAWTWAELMDRTGLSDAEQRAAMARLRDQAVTRGRIPIWDMALGAYRFCEFDAAAQSFNRYRRWRLKYMLTAARRLEAMLQQAVLTWNTPGLALSLHSMQRLVADLEWVLAQPD